MRRGNGDLCSNQEKRKGRNGGGGSSNLTIRMQSNVDAQPQARDRHHVCEQLRRGVYPQEAGEGEDPDENRAHGEEEHKRKTHDGSMRNRRRVDEFEIGTASARGSTLEAAPPQCGRGRGAGSARGGAWIGLRDEGVEGVSAFGDRQVKVDVAHDVVLMQVGGLGIVFDGVAAFDGPNPWRIARSQIHGAATPTGAAGTYAQRSMLTHCDPLWWGRAYVQRTLAVIFPLAIPDPSSSETCALLLNCGSTSCTPRRGERVMLEPVASAYTMKMFEFLIWFCPPWPRPIHCNDEGPWIWK